MREGMTLAAVGMVTGVLAALGISRFAASLLVGVAATDPATYVAVAVLVAVATALACFVPARRAARADPVEALREG